MKIGYTIAAYLTTQGRDNHSNCSENIYYYIDTQIECINSIKLDLYKIYIVCTISDELDSSKLVQDLRSKYSGDPRIIISSRPNLGGSYCSWHHALTLDEGDCDYMFLLEDDYTVIYPEAIESLIKYFKNSKDLLYVCQMWTDKPYSQDGFTVQNHTAISNGLLNNKLYYSAKKKGLDFHLIEGTSKESICLNQVLFLNPFVQAGYSVADIRNDYSSIFAASKTESIEYGKVEGVRIFLPIIPQFFN